MEGGAEVMEISKSGGGTGVEVKGIGQRLGRWNMTKLMR